MDRVPSHHLKSKAVSEVSFSKNGSPSIIPSKISMNSSPRPIQKRALEESSECESDYTTSSNTKAHDTDIIHPPPKRIQTGTVLQNTRRPPAYNFTRYCYRHNPETRDSGSTTGNYSQDLKRLQQINKRISKLPISEQADIHYILAKFANSNDKIRRLIFDGLLATSCFPQLSYVSSEVKQMIKLDFISTLPRELAFKILSYLDCQSLCNSMLVCRHWNKLANDDRIWYHMCRQHIDRKCPHCGWGLPLLQMKNNYRSRGKVGNGGTLIKNPWKAIYRDRFEVESNWRKGHCRVSCLNGHMDGVLALQFRYGFLFTASYDSTVAIWDTHTGKLLRRLTGHLDGVKALYFDEQKLITGSLDRTIKVWNYVTGECISTYRGHTDSVMALDSFNRIIVSGSADKTVKVWHIETRTCYTLRGHTEWVNAVKLHPKSFTCYSCSDDTTIRMWDLRTNECLKIFRGHVGQVQKVIPLTIIDVENLVVDPVPSDVTDGSQPQGGNEDESGRALDESIPYPTHLLSCSLDNTIKLWDVRTGKCVRTQFGHLEGVWDIAADNFRIISGSHDGLIKVWDLQSGKCMHTFQGSRLELNSGTGGQTGADSGAPAPREVPPIACVAIGDSEFFAGDELGCVRMFRFDNFNSDTADKQDCEC